MKIKITMKDPDGVWDGIMEAVLDNNPSLSVEDAREEVNSILYTEKLLQVFRYGEYLDLEYDTEMGTVEII